MLMYIHIYFMDMLWIAIWWWWLRGTTSPYGQTFLDAAYREIIFHSIEAAWAMRVQKEWLRCRYETSFTVGISGSTVILEPKPKGKFVIPEPKPKGKLIILCIHGESRTFTCIFCKFSGDNFIRINCYFYLTNHIFKILLRYVYVVL